MAIERSTAPAVGDPFPVYPQAIEALASAHLAAAGGRDAIIAHVLATCAGYAYADLETLSTIMARMGLDNHACVRISQTVDAMFIFSTAYLIQSRCGRVVILCYRGTEPATLGNWIGDADVGSEQSTMSLANGTERVRVHAGFLRNVRATWPAVISELTAALEGRSLVSHDVTVEHKLEALYVTGHSLGGAMALLFALKASADRRHQSVADRLRAVYTFGQPMAVAAPIAPSVIATAARVFRHVNARDPVPCLPASAWGPFVHVGREYRYENAGWRQADSPVAQLSSMKEIGRAGLALFAPAQRRASSRYSFAEHGPHEYITALRPAGRITEFGD